MKKDNHTRYAILGLLTTGCNTGYSIKQMIDNSLSHFWKISYGQIYPTLKSLVEEGYASVRITEQEARPDKKEYQITSAGIQLLQDWLQMPVLELPTEKNETLLKLFFSRHQGKVRTLELLDNHKEKLEQRYNTYKGIKEMIESRLSDGEDAVYWIMTLDYGLLTTNAAIDWCESAKEKLTK
ncbi:PadR family transcriptional regulator [Sediminibacillus massiliensis]|uniref:PadR family transcriptional regulator n=1 Tax=Sediminibacillus massiliensis TaxID=1926277 RepID=UPI000988884D|nr:PadR family transcriptional regulator [Sediminibacillus massiliensis]